jgi:hypothetical protein
MRREKNEWPVLEAILGTSEVGTDFLFANIFGAGGDVFSDIPIVGTLVQGLKAVNSIRDRALAAKLERFLEPFAEESKKNRDRFKKRLMQDEAETRRVGETLFLVVDNCTDLDKAEILGYLFVAFLNGQMSSSELRRMAQAVDMCFADDLAELISSDGRVAGSKNIWIKSLVASGLAEPVGGKTWDNAGDIYYSLTELGRELRSAYLSVKTTC